MKEHVENTNISEEASVPISMAMAGRIEGENDQMLMVMVTILCGELKRRRGARER